MVNEMKKRGRKALVQLTALIVFLAFGAGILSGPALAIAGPDKGLDLPAPGTRLSTSAAFTPPLLKALVIDPDNPLMFDFVVDQGDTRLAGEELEAESSKLLKYFLTSLTIPAQDIWVNLSPQEEDRIIPEAFGQTEMGRDLLAQDYLLKQLTASLLYPEEDLGQEFWQRVYEQAYERFGTTEIPVNTFNKVWIMPDKAVVYEHNNTAFVAESRLKVMLERDYLSTSDDRRETIDEGSSDVSLRATAGSAAILSKGREKAYSVERTANQVSLPDPQVSLPDLIGQSMVVDPPAKPEDDTKEEKGDTEDVSLRATAGSAAILHDERGLLRRSTPRNDTNDISQEILREIILPEIEKEVNEGATFAPLRQVYHSLILAAWYKNTLKQSFLTRAYADQNKISGVDGVDEEMKDKIYAAYLAAFQQGVFNMIREEIDPVTQTPIPRKYFSGGIVGEVIPEGVSGQEALSPAQSSTVKAAVGRGDGVYSGRVRLDRTEKVWDLDKVEGGLASMKLALSKVLEQRHQGHTAVMTVGEKRYEVLKDLHGNIKRERYVFLVREVLEDGSKSSPKLLKLYLSSAKLLRKLKGFFRAIKDDAVAQEHVAMMDTDSLRSWHQGEYAMIEGEYLEGRRLDEIMDLGERLEVISEAVEGLVYLQDKHHVAGHGDLIEGNILKPDGRPAKILDWDRVSRKGGPEGHSDRQVQISQVGALLQWVYEGGYDRVNIDIPDELQAIIERAVVFDRKVKHYTSLRELSNDLNAALSTMRSDGRLAALDERVVGQEETTVVSSQVVDLDQDLRNAEDAAGLLLGLSQALNQGPQILKVAEKTYEVLQNLGASARKGRYLYQVRGVGWDGVLQKEKVLKLDLFPRGWEKGVDFFDALQKDPEGQKRVAMMDPSSWRLWNDGRFMLMEGEYVEGRKLDEIESLAEKLEVIAEAIESMAYFQERHNAVYWDVKPEHIIKPEGLPAKLSDWDDVGRGSDPWLVVEVLKSVKKSLLLWALFEGVPDGKVLSAFDIPAEIDSIIKERHESLRELSQDLNAALETLRADGRLAHLDPQGTPSVGIATVSSPLRNKGLERYVHKYTSDYPPLSDDDMRLAVFGVRSNDRTYFNRKNPLKREHHNLDGTGFVVGEDDRYVYVLTKSGVIGNPQEVVLYRLTAEPQEPAALISREGIPVELMARDRLKNLALLKVRKTKIPQAFKYRVATFLSPQRKPGRMVFKVLGLIPDAKFWYFLNDKSEADGFYEYDNLYVEEDRFTWPGSSGGPVVEKASNFVLGMPTGVEGVTKFFSLRKMLRFLYANKVPNIRIADISADSALRDKLSSAVLDVDRTEANYETMREGYDFQVSSPGGIDFNPDKINVEVRRDGAPIAIPAIDPNILESSPINGFTPVIIHLAPATNLPLLLGLPPERF